MKKILICICALILGRSFAQENKIQIINQKKFIIKENQRIRLKIKHHKRIWLKTISGKFQFSKNKDSITVQRHIFGKKHKVAVDDIIKIKRHPLVVTVIMNVAITSLGVAIFYQTPFIFGVIASSAYQVFISGLNLLKSYNIKTDEYSMKTIVINNPLVEEQ